MPDLSSLLLAIFHANPLLLHLIVYDLVDPRRNKGTAIERFMEHAPFKGRRPVFVGDDITDVPAMHQAAQMQIS